jgi:uncharacterized membrane protein YccC
MTINWPTIRRDSRAEARAMVTPGPRLSDEIACIASVMLAIVLAHWIGARMVGWAAFTAFVLMRGNPVETMLRGVLRIVGTVAGAGLALVLVPTAARSLPLSMICAALVGGLGLYGMLTARRAYAWLLFGLTFEMILLDKLENPALDTIDFARTRLLEVVAGTVACVSVSLVTAWLTRNRAGGVPLATPQRMHWHPGAARHAAQAAVTLALLPLLRHFTGIPQLAQAGVTIMAVMIVPVAGLGASGLAPVSRRLLHRAIGSLSGAVLAIAVLVIARGSVPILVAGTCLGIWIGRHIETGSTRAPYIGLQFTLSILVVLVPDSYAQVRMDPGIDRLLSILIGMALLEPVLLAWHAVAPRDPASRQDQPNRSGE